MRDSGRTERTRPSFRGKRAQGVSSRDIYNVKNNIKSFLSEHDELEYSYNVHTFMMIPVVHVRIVVGDRRIYHDIMHIDVMIRSPLVIS